MNKSSNREDRTRFPLPVPIDDASRICVKVYIPNIPGHRQAFQGAIYNLTKWYSWTLEPTKQARLAADVWKPIYEQMMETFYDDCPDEDHCFTFPPSAGFIEWFPNNPYTEPDLITAGYNTPAWYEANEASNLILGTQFGDIVTDLSRFPPGSLPSIIPASGLPRFRINIAAPGIVTIHLLNILAGSLAQITIDDEISTVRFIDLNRDQLAVPFETATTTPVEVEVLGAGAHHIDVIIVSQINDSIPFLHHGGGLRKVEICGEAADMPFYELRQSPDDPCLVEQKLTADGEWIEAFRMDNCCDDDQDPTGQRISDEGYLEVTFDGMTWEVDKTGDTRFTNPTLPPIPNANDETRCAAANGIVTILKEKQENDLEAKNTGTTFADFIPGLVGFLIAAGVITGGTTTLLAIITTAIASLVFHITVNDFAAAFSEATWDTLLCIIYCNMSDDGGIDEAQWIAIQNQTVTEIGGYASDWIKGHLQALGPVGLTNTARQGHPGTRDCSTCGCGDCACDLLLWEWPSELPQPTNFERHTESCSITSDYVISTGYAYFALQSTECCTLSVNTISAPAGGYDFIGVIPCDYNGAYTFANESVGWMPFGSVPIGIPCKALLLRFHDPAEHNVHLP